MIPSMDEQTQKDIIQEQFLKGSYQPASSTQDSISEGFQLLKVVTSNQDFINTLRQELKGEQLYQEESGERYWIQVDKPAFVKLDKNNEPIKIFNSKTKREEYVPNDEAINEILKIVKLSGLNPVSPLTIVSEQEIRADLFALESKLAVLLANKRKKWGIDKAIYPTLLESLKILIKDARYRSKEGTILKLAKQITHRIEQENVTHGKQGWRKSVEGAIR